MRIAVMGTGGVGGVFGARLAAAGEDVVFIARGEHLRAIQTDGLRIEAARNPLHIKPARATDSPATVGPVDLVLFAVKMWDTEAAAEQIRPLIGPDTGVISIQNGIDNEDKIAAILGPEHVLGGVAYIFATLAGPGRIEQASPARLVVGELDGRQSPRLQAFAAACARAVVDCDIAPEIRQVLWTKFMSNCAGNGITSVTRTPVGPVRDDPDTRELYRRCLVEVAAVGRAKGVDLPEGVVDTLMAGLDRLPPHLRTSTEQDLARGNRLELDGLNGAVVRLGREMGVETPVNWFIYAVLKPHAAGRAG